MKYLPLNVLKLHRMLKQTLFQPTVAEQIDFIVIRLPLWYKFTSFFSVSSLKLNYSCKTTVKKKKASPKNMPHGRETLTRLEGGLLKRSACSYFWGDFSEF